MSGTFCPWGTIGSESVSLAPAAVFCAVWQLSWACGSGTALVHRWLRLAYWSDTEHSSMPLSQMGPSRPYPKNHVHSWRAARRGIRSRPDIVQDAARTEVCTTYRLAFLASRSVISSVKRLPSGYERPETCRLFRKRSTAEFW